MALIYPVTTGIDLSPLPPGWRWCKLTEVARLESGHTPSRREPSYWEDGTVPWLSLKDMKNLSGKYIYQTEDMPTAKGIENSSARILPKGTVAFCRTASVGNAVILGTDMATSQDFANWVCSPAILPEYLYEALRASGAQFDKEKQGSTHKTIYMPVLENFRVLLPSLSEQHRIVDIIDKADAIRRKRKQAIALTDQLLRSTFLEMFGDPVTNPKGWPVRSLGEVSDLFSGNSLPMGEEYDGQQDGILLLKVGDMNLLGNENAISTSREWSSGITGCIVAPVGSVVFPKRGGAISTNKKRYLMREAALDPNLMAVAPKKIISTDFLLGWFDLIDLAVLSNGSTIPQLNKKDIAPLRTIVPSGEIQECYANFCRHVRSLREKSERARSQADQLFESLAHRAFRGELVRTEQIGRQLAMFNK